LGMRGGEAARNNAKVPSMIHGGSVLPKIARRHTTARTGLIGAGMLCGTASPRTPERGGLVGEVRDVALLPSKPPLASVFACKVAEARVANVARATKCLYEAQARGAVTDEQERAGEALAHVGRGGARPFGGLAVSMLQRDLGARHHWIV